MRMLGLDVGSKTIGVALSDPMGITAQAFTVIRRATPEKDFDAIRNIVRAYDVGRIVVGLPLNMNGSVGPAAQAVEEFCRALRGKVEIPVVTWDERLSTVMAERAMLEADVSRKKRRRVIDKAAAALILQGYLDHHLNDHHPGE
ncbi:MAG: Holliday junction resolvase RuvX [Firmicutes bacterium]|nr:Holliday junction resolvase RuvX [Bacillota bacterium]